MFCIKLVIYVEYHVYHVSIFFYSEHDLRVKTWVILYVIIFH